MFTLNIYTPATQEEPQSKYFCSVTQNTRKECMAIANKKYSGMGWEWDEKNYVKNKKYRGDPSTTVCVSLSSIIS
jgi:hypothetical protein